MNTDKEYMVRKCQQTLVSTDTAKKEGIHYEIQGKPWEDIVADVFTVNNNNFLCVVDFHSMFSLVKLVEKLSAGSLILYCKIILQNMGCVER